MVRISVALGLAALLVGCVTDVDMPLDLDKDGLLDIEELDIGTDPNEADSDGDGHLDGAELEMGFDPLDYEDHPYMGGYEIDLDCRNNVMVEGNSMGEVTDKISGPDQFGEMVTSHDFCGKALLLINALDT